jgi:hypothetical protein
MLLRPWAAAAVGPGVCTLAKSCRLVELSRPCLFLHCTGNNEQGRHLTCFLRPAPCPGLQFCASQIGRGLEQVKSVAVRVFSWLVDLAGLGVQHSIDLIAVPDCRVLLDNANAFSMALQHAVSTYVCCVFDSCSNRKRSKAHVPYERSLPGRM